MNTLFDFITHVKGIEYILSLLFIAGFVILWETLKPKPFRSLVENMSGDAEHVRQAGWRGTLRAVGTIAAAPFIGLAYILILPFSFIYALAQVAADSVMSLAAGGASFGWRPLEAYLTGKKDKIKKNEDKQEDPS